MPDSAPPARRFEIALSFPGERRDVVEKVAARLAEEFTPERVLYDEYHDAEFARLNLKVYLPTLYLDHSELIVVFLCPEYVGKKWCRLEWRNVSEMIEAADQNRIMLVSFGKMGRIPELGILEGDGKLDVTGLSPELIAEKILKRLLLNRGSATSSVSLPPDFDRSLDLVTSSRLTLSNLPGEYIGAVFLGRDQFLDTIRRSLLGQNHTTAITQKHAAIGIFGLGGIGKTHAAVEYARRHHADYTALLFAPAHTPEKLQSSLANLCTLLRLDENGRLPTDESARLRAVLEWLSTHIGWLLILDNVDDEPAALAVQKIIGQLTTGHVLITSRLHGWSSQVKGIDLDVLSEAFSIELLIQLTADRRRVSPNDETQVRHLADLLDGLPLAIHQAAGCINEQTLTLTDYIARFHEEAENVLNWFSDLSIPYERPDKLAPRPVLVTWKTNFDQLSADDQFWLLVFSHFASDPIPRFLLEPPDDATPPSRSALHKAGIAVARAGKYSLITRSTTEPLFKLHRLVQQITRHYASEALRKRAISDAIQLVVQANPGNSQDVRTWPKWNPLQAHAQAICAYAPDAPILPNFTWLLIMLGLLLRTKALHAEAERHVRRVLRINRVTYGNDHPDVARDLADLATLLQDTNHLSEAESLNREALRITRIAFGDHHPRVATDLNNLAILLNNTGRSSEAEPLFREALQIDRAAYGENHPDVARDINNLAVLLLDTNRLSEAEPLAHDSLRIVRAVYGDDHPKVSTRLHNLSRLFKASNRLSEAESLNLEAVRIDRAAYGDDHPTVAFRLNHLALVLQARSHLSDAEPLMRDALRIFHKSLGPEHPNTLGVTANLKSLLKEMKSQPPES